MIFIFESIDNQNPIWNSKVIISHQDSKKSPACERQSDYTFADCVYGLKQRKLVEMFNCTLLLFSNQFYPGKKLRECTFRNVSKHNVDHFLEYISNNNGKGMLYVLRKEYSVNSIILQNLIIIPYFIYLFLLQAPTGVKRKKYAQGHVLNFE